LRKILIIMGRYLPGYKDGGPVRSIKNLIDRLGNEYDFHILTADRDHGDTCPYPDIKVREWNQVGNAKVFYVEPGGFDAETVKNCATNMDLIYMCGCFNDYARTTLMLKKKGEIKCKVIIAAMGLFSPGAFRIKYPKKKAYTTLLKWMGYFSDVQWSATDEQEAADIRRQVGSDAVCCLAEDLPRKPEHIVHKTISDKGSLRVIFLSRISKKKNLLFCIKILQKCTEGDIVFDIYGNKEDIAYWQECEKELHKLPGNVKWTYKGIADAEKVVEIFADYDVFLFPTMAENYGHVIFEAMAGGCVPIISDRTPWNEEKADGVLTHIELNERDETIEAFAKELGKYVEMSTEQMQSRADACIRFASTYRAEEAEEQYRRILEL